MISPIAMVNLPFFFILIENLETGFYKKLTKTGIL